jgi:sec-independent protein translocase protein TatA
MFGFGAPEMIVVGLIALVLFGNRVPEVMRSLGKGISEFRKGMTNVEQDIRQIGSPEPSSRQGL